MLATFVPSGRLWLLLMPLLSAAAVCCLLLVWLRSTYYSSTTVRVAVTVTSQRQMWQASGGCLRLGLSTDVRDACRVLYPYLMLMVYLGLPGCAGRFYLYAN
jgi:hypothetical protein